MTRYTLILLVLLASAAAQATEYRFVADDLSAQTRFCVAAAENDIDGLRGQMRKLRQSPHHQYKDIVNAIRCNDQGAAQFAHRYGASETFAYLYPLTAREQRDLIPHTSVEEVALTDSSDQDSATVLVHVRGR